MSANDLNEWTGVVRVVGSAFIGAIVGFDREAKNKTAGLRTHMLVAAGSCLFVVTAVLAFDEENDKAAEVDETYLAQNPDRILAGIATGVGFLGGGAIVKTDGHIRGLTTAAGIWVVAGIGATVAYGRWALGLISAALATVIHLSEYIVHRYCFCVKDEIIVEEPQEEEEKEEAAAADSPKS